MDEPTGSRDSTVDGFRSRLGDIEQRIDELRKRVARASNKVRRHVTPFVDQLEESRQAIQATVHTLRESAADRAQYLADRVRDELSGLEHESEAAREELRAELADNAHGFKEAADKELTAWRALLDHLRVQANLGRMEVRDELETLRARAERALADARRRLDDITEQGEGDIETLRSGLRDVLDDIRQTIREMRNHAKVA